MFSIHSRLADVKKETAGSELLDHQPIPSRLIIHSERRAAAAACALCLSNLMSWRCPAAAAAADLDPSSASSSPTLRICDGFSARNEKEVKNNMVVYVLVMGKLPFVLARKPICGGMEYKLAAECR